MRPGLFRAKLAMKVVVRPLESTDLERDLMRLRILTGPHNPKTHDINRKAYITDRHSRRWRWLERHVLADQMHRWVADAEGEIVGHLGALRPPRQLSLSSHPSHISLGNLIQLDLVVLFLAGHPKVGGGDSCRTRYAPLGVVG